MAIEHTSGLSGGGCFREAPLCTGGNLMQHPGWHMEHTLLEIKGSDMLVQELEVVARGGAAPLSGLKQ